MVGSRIKQTVRKKAALYAKKNNHQFTKPSKRNSIKT
jgi:hypothetical protein